MRKRTKEVLFRMTDEEYMLRAVELAKKGT